MKASEPSASPPAAPTDRRRRHRAATIESILDAARAVMREQGAAALTLNEVARRLGIKPPSLYEYFPGGKKQVYDALFLRGMALFAERLAPPARQPHWADYLRESMRAYLRFALDYPELYQLCFERPVPGFVPSAEAMQVSLANYQAGVAEVARRLAAGELEPPPGLTAQQVADLAIATMHGLASQHLANEPHLPPGQGRYGALIPAAVDLFARAWTPASQRRDLSPPLSGVAP